jgi:chaperonin cofactor prefoldin
MRSVNLFVDLSGLDEKTSSQLKRGVNAVSTIYSLRKVGGTVVSKANVAIALLDATLSVLDAIGSYARYRQAKEVTKQLEMEAEMLRIQLSELHAQFRIFKDEIDMEISVAVATIKRRLVEDSYEIKIQIDCYNNLKEQVKRVGNELSKLRRNSAPRCLKLHKIEIEYYKLVATQIQAAVEIVDR